MLMILASAISYFQAIVLGVLQGVTELFPISSLGHTVLFPTLFGWNELVDAQSQPESFWLAFVVMLHVGSAIGLLFYYRRDWVEIVTAFFRTLATRRAETSTERLAWLIIVASIPAGLFGLAFEHQLRTLTAKPEVAAILLMVNGLRAVRGRALPPPSGRARTGGPGGAQPRGRTRARHARVPRGAGRSASPSRRALLAGISRDGVTMGAGLARGLDHSDSARFAFLLATPIILAAGLFKLPDLLGHLGERDSWAGPRGVCLCGHHGRLHGCLPGQILQDPHADPIRDLLSGVRRGDGHLHAGLLINISDCV